MVTWDSIECIKRNGLITSYTVESDISAGSISGRIFLAEGLTPGRQYKFRVAGATDVDTGPFTRTISITTNEEGLVIIITREYTHGNSMAWY